MISLKIHAKSVWCLLFITIGSFLILLFTQDRVYDISLAIFGSSSIALIISTVSYNCERKKVLENFYNTISKRISYYSSYLQSWSTEDKSRFYINHFLKDFPSIGNAYADIYFFWDFKKKKRNYIYNNIYSKCRDMANYIDSRYYNFATYINKTGEAKHAIENYIKDIETRLFKENGNKIESDFMNTIMNKLNGEYYKIMYGKEMDCDNSGNK